MKMPVAVEASTYLYLYSAQPAMTAISSRPAQQRVRIAPYDSYFTAGATFSSKPSVDGASSAQENWVPAETPATHADLTVAQISRLEALDADWDGNDAAKPLSFSLKEARDFVRSLAPESLIPRPALHADGHAILFLQLSDRYVELEFLGNKRVGFYARRGEQEWSDEIVFDGRTLPSGLLQIGLAT
jgi:hypothetical protein